MCGGWHVEEWRRLHRKILALCENLRKNKEYGLTKRTKFDIIKTTPKAIAKGISVQSVRMQPLLVRFL
jgi:hypothetical protein